MRPVLCRVPSYSSPGFPSPTTTHDISRDCISIPYYLPRFFLRPPSRRNVHAFQSVSPCISQHFHQTGETSTHVGVLRRPTGTVLLHSPAPQYEAHFSGVFRSASAREAVFSQQRKTRLQKNAPKTATHHSFSFASMPPQEYNAPT